MERGRQGHKVKPAQRETPEGWVLSALRDLKANLVQQARPDRKEMREL